MKIRKTGRKFFDWFGKNKLYFMRGYNQYFQLPISLINSAAILYYLVVNNMTGVPSWFRFYVFVAIFLNTIILFGWSMGKFDYMKGTFNQEQKTFAEQSPIWVEHFANQKRIKENQERLEDKVDRMLRLFGLLGIFEDKDIKWITVEDGEEEKKENEKIS